MSTDLNGSKEIKFMFEIPIFCISCNNSFIFKDVLDLTYDIYFVECPYCGEKFMKEFRPTDKIILYKK